MFEQAWTLLRDNFFDAAFNGVELGSLARALRPARGVGAARPTSCAAIVSLMMGDLNASHLGIVGAGGGGAGRSAGSACASIAASTSRRAGCA